MAQFIVSAKSAVTSSAANTEDVFLQIRSVPTASTTLMIKRIRVSEETPSDNRLQIRGYLTTSTAAGIASTTAVPKSALSVVAAASSFVKNGTTSTNPGGLTLTATLFAADINGRGVYEFIARDEEDYYETFPSTFFTLALLCTSASVTTNVTIEYLE